MPGAHIKERMKERFEQLKNSPPSPEVNNILRAHELQKKIDNLETTLSDIEDFIERYTFDINKDFPSFAGQTFVHFAAKAGRLDILKYFVEEKNSDPDKHAIMFGGSIAITPLFLAVQKNHSDIIIYLCSKGADLNVENIKGETLFEIAKKSNTISQDAINALNPKSKNDDKHD